MPIRDLTGRPRRSGYSFVNQGAAAAANPSGVGKFVIRRLPGVDFWSPSWGEETIIRIFPAISPDDHTQFDPFRLSTKDCDFGDWIRVYDAVRNFGNPGVTMLLHDGLNQSYDAQLMNPCWILYRAINQALSQGQGMAEWVPLTKGSTGKSAQLSKPSKLYLVQCAIFRHKSKDTFGPGKPPLGASNEGPTIVMGLPPTAGENLIQLLEDKDDDWKGDPNDMAQYKYGDVVGIDQGAFVHVYELGKDPRSRFGANRQAATPASIYASNPSTRSGGMEAKGYGVFITKTLDGGPEDVPATLTGMEDMVKSRAKLWSDILEFKTDTEQAHLIAPLFPPSAILYAWRDHPAWIPESVRDAGSYDIRKPVSASITGTTTQAWAPKRQTAQTPPPYPIQDEVSPSDTSPQAESLGEDPFVDEASRLAAARAQLEASKRRVTAQAK